MMYRSERERRDEETGHWQLLDEIRAAIRCEYQSNDEVIEALLTAAAEIIVQADYSPEQIKRVKQSLDSTIDFQRALNSLPPNNAG